MMMKKKKKKEEEEEKKKKKEKKKKNKKIETLTDNVHNKMGAPGSTFGPLTPFFNLTPFAMRWNITSDYDNSR